jgi:hypothetical protein
LPFAGKIREFCRINSKEIAIRSRNFQCLLVSKILATPKR